MLTFTLDTNCIISIDESREPAATAIRRLVLAHERGLAKVAVTAVSASENQKGPPLDNFQRFQERMKRLQLSTLEILPTLLYYDISFWDWQCWGDDETFVLERQIHDILFPTSPFLWPDYCTANGLDIDTAPISDPWRNRKCDVLGMWSHIRGNRDVFVTDDGNFHREAKRSRLVALGAGAIMHPVAAAAIIP